MIREPIGRFLEHYRKGDYEEADTQTQLSAGWKQWVCPQKSLKSRLKRIFDILSMINNPILLDEYYAEFNNYKSEKGLMYDMVDINPVDIKSSKRRYRLLINSQKADNCRYGITIEQSGKKINAELNEKKSVAELLSDWTEPEPETEAESEYEDTRPWYETL